MSVELGKKKEIIKKFAKNEEDTGSPDDQVAILTKRIGVLTSHLVKNKKGQLIYFKILVKIII